MRNVLRVAIFGACAVLCLLAACSPEDGGNTAQGEEERKPMTTKITSTAFVEGASIPQRHTCQGSDVSPALFWENAPAGTASFALICDDPDAPAKVWVHWVIYGIPAGETGLPENVPKTETLKNGSRQGMTDSRRIGYSGPCPPPGQAHRYYFKLYALDSMPDLKPGATKDTLLAAMKGHVLAEAQLMGTYKRK